ncbi:MAG: RnfABCDGE type electron transport complex subunit B [bacterium]|nr:RnfABCDGE type electron transport complex subunit B [bacterium]
MLTVTLITLAAATMLALAVAAGSILGWANRAFYVAVDARVTRIQSVLPGVNCSGCGYVGCGEYAEAVAAGDAAVNLCAPGGASCAQAVAGIMGVDVEPSWPYRAIVHCAARFDQRLGRSEYRGELSCSAANLVAGYQGCTYGCLGLEDCVRSCEFDAIHVIEGLAVIDYRKCTGCGACVDACPRHIISRVPFKASRILAVACSNQDFGNDVRAVCTFGCIGCKACERVSSLFAMQDNLPVLDYDSYEPDSAPQAEELDKSIEKCPMESLLWVGEPAPEDILATADEELPLRAVADFKTTVDQAEWRG